MPGESIDKAILPDVAWIIEQFKVRITDGYAPTGHEASGDHPKGAGVDIVPDTARGGTWQNVAELAAFAKQHPQTFRWIGWNGTPGHGDPQHAGEDAHLHLSWHGYGTAGDTRPVKLASEENRRGNLGRIFSPFGGSDDAVEDIGGAVVDAAGDAAAGTAKAIVGLVVDAIGHDGARVLLSVALVLVGAGAVAFGTARALGLRTPPLPIPAAAAAKAIKGGA